MVDLISFQDALKTTEGKDRNLLLGNGFSIAQTQGAMSYKNLLEQSDLIAKEPVKNVFSVFNTVDFETVIHALENAASVEEAYGDKTKKEKFSKDADLVREALIQAIHKVHPSTQSNIPAHEIEVCGKFLELFGNIFTLNYDLLMYWVNLNKQPKSHADGFGLGEESGGFRTFSTHAYCSVYNLHGGLHLFKDEQGDTLKRISTGATILADIEKTIRNEKRLPIFVAEGTSAQKLAKINSVPYLKHGLDTLKEQAAPIFIFGHSADENDSHVYRSIFYGQSSEVYFCVFNKEKSFVAIQEKLAKYSVRAKAKKIHYVDASNMDIWGKSRAPKKAVANAK